MHDAQFVPRDFPLKRGWGHSLFGQACELAAMAEVRHLILFHHDPDRTDTQLDAIQEESQLWMTKHAPHTQVTAGYEGMVIEF
jgi:ribonuclease BN (tRNA processing enzyme)